jgi:hypothetical protein
VQRVDLDLAVEVTDVADDRAIFHPPDVIDRDDVDVAVVCGFGNVGKGSAASLRGQGARVIVTATGNTAIFARVPVLHLVAFRVATQPSRGMKWMAVRAYRSWGEINGRVPATVHRA